MKTIVVNGANGYVASHFIARLIKTGHKVVALVRPSHNYTAEERMHNILAEINGDETKNTENLSVAAYSLLEKDFALRKKTIEAAFGTDVDYFHFAASLKYDEKSIEEIFATNIEGVKNSVGIFRKYASEKSRFFYIGTAYSCGKYNGIFEEKFYKNDPISSFRNYYELSKRYGENIIRQNIEKNNLNGHVIRLSQVVGDHRTGVTKTDYGIFDFAKRVYKLASRYPNEVLRVKVDPVATQNLIPIDTVVNDLARVVQSDSAPGIMNFVAKQSIKNEYIINSLNEVLPVTLIPLKNLDSESMNSLERLISIGMSFTGRYADTNLKFDTTQRDKVIQSGEDDELNKEDVYAMIKYFIETLSAQKQKTVAA